MFALGAGAFLSLALFLHRVSWWPAPLVLGLAHAALGTAVGLVVGHITTQGRRPASSEELSNASGGTLIRRGASYDWLVRFLLVGNERRFRDEIIDLGEIQPGEAVLDVGSGTGTLLIAAADRVGTPGLLRGIEPSPEMLARAKAKAAARHLEIGFTEGSAAALPFEDASFDLVFCTLVLHHLPADVQSLALSEMRRVLRPGGRLVVADLDTRSRGAAMSLVGLLHGLGTSTESSLLSETAARLREADFESVTTHRTRSRAIGCVVARLPAAD